MEKVPHFAELFKWKRSDFLNQEAVSKDFEVLQSLQHPILYSDLFTRWLEQSIMLTVGFVEL